MRIAMIGQKGIPALYGGVESHVEELSRELVNQGNEVIVYARKWYTPEILNSHQGIKIVHTPTIHTKHLDAIVHTFTSTIHAIKHGVDIIHYHGVGPSLLSWIPRVFAPKIKVVSTFHCIDRYHQKWGAFARFALAMGEWASCNFADETIAVSKTIQNYCFNEFHREARYIPNGVTLEENTGHSTLKEWDLEPNKYFLMVSRLVRHKGAHYLIAAWQSIKETRPELIADHKLVIVGDSAFTDEYVNEIKQACKNDSSVVFTGWQHGQALNELFANARMLVHPSENEGMSCAVLRAMSVGKAVLASDIPEQQELIDNRNFLFANANQYSLADKLIKILAGPPIMEEEGRKNKKLAQEKFNWKKIVNETISLYEKYEPEAIKIQEVQSL